MTKNNIFDAFNKHSLGFTELYTNYVESNFPHYNIEQNPADGDFTVTLAVAGYGKQELSVSMQKGKMTVNGLKYSKDEDEDAAEALYKGITTKNFEKVFAVSADLEVDKVNLKAGLLSIKLKHKPVEQADAIEIEED